MITCRRYRDGALAEEPFDPGATRALLAGEGAGVWVDAEDPTEDELALIQRAFALHPLSVEDSRHWGQRTKVEVFPHYVFVVVHGVSLGTELADSEVHLFAGPRFLVTLRAAPAFDLEPVLRRVERQPELATEGAGFLLYALLDAVVDGYLSAVERLEDLSDDIEDRAFADHPDPGLQQDIFRLKRQTVELRRIAVPVREVVELVQGQPGLLTPELAPYYRDVVDHAIRTVEFVDNVREVLTAALEAQLAQTSNRLNAIMRQVTSWGAIVLVPTLIAGIYGMNFRHMPELDWRLGYAFALGLMVASAAALYAVFRRRGWL